MMTRGLFLFILLGKWLGVTHETPHSSTSSTNVKNAKVTTLYALSDLKFLSRTLSLDITEKQEEFGEIKNKIIYR